ncbi:MAG: hypothetical protein C0501_29565 [Isosphaera sp.]|nr:hypothetical protein [Isosphaera sp.]
MPRPEGRSVPLTPARRMIAELMRACRGVPAVVAERRMDLADVAAARRAAGGPRWAAVFARGFALVAADTPALRRSYLSFPWGRLYEHAEPAAAVTVEREYRGEVVVFPARLRRPHLRPVADLDADLARAKDGPPGEVPGFRRWMRAARLPGPARRLALWLALHASGRLRGKHVGTFGVTTVGGAGAGLVRVLTPLTATLHFGLLDPAGRLDVRLTFDHRVFDGATAARALVALEDSLRGAVRDELRRSAARAA